MPTGENMKFKNLTNIFLLLSLSVSSFAYAADDDEDSNKRSVGGIEEVTVTAEKRTSTVSDTSMSISAFDSSLIEDLGLTGADALMDQLPATTRDEYDVRIRGVGRNFRALGGDPGVSTYYNGIYSPDFGIAASENAYFDVERIEVLRGPQGTLYGRNSIGGAINYITKKPSFDSETELRTIQGSYGLQSYAFMNSAALTDSIAYRIVGTSVERDGTQAGDGDSPDLDSLNDENAVLTLLWNINDDMSFQVRANDRLSDRKIPAQYLVNEGYGPNRGTINTKDKVWGLKAVTANYPGAVKFTNPINGAIGYGAPLIPGVDNGSYPGHYNPMYGRTDIDTLGNEMVRVNNDANCNKWPYPDGCAAPHVEFDQNGQQMRFDWDINERTQFTYLYGLVDFEYMFNRDFDESDSEFSQQRDNVNEDVHMTTHEITFNWMLGDSIEMTSGAFYMDENRQQNYSLHNSVPQIMNAASYGALDIPFGTLKAATGINLGYPDPYTVMIMLGWAPGDTAPWGTAPLQGATESGRWMGNKDGMYYRHANEVQTDAYAFYTQGTWDINDQWALTLGARYAEDEKTALEKRGGYAELYASALAGFLPAMNLLMGAPYIPLGVAGNTPLAATNVALGAATYSGDANVITPTCEYNATTCAAPLRLWQGIPYAYTSTIGGTDTWSDTNVRVNVDYEPNDNVLLYLSYTTGYRSGGYGLGISGARDDQRDSFGIPNGTGQVLSSYDQEEVTAVEFGYKGLHLDDTLQIFASIYHYNYDGYQDQVEQVDPLRGTGVDNVTNADGITNQGFETDFTYAATDRLTLSGNYSFTETEYGEDYIILMIDDPANPATVFGTCTQAYVSCSVTGPQASQYSFNAKGSSLKGIPGHKSTLRANYEFSTMFGPVWGLVNYSYTGDFSASGIDRDLDRVPARETWNLSASWWNDSGDLSVRAYISNLKDEDNLRGYNTADAGGNYRLTGFPLAPREMGFDIRYKF